MKKRKILRVCHKFLIDNDGYDLDIQDLCCSTSKKYDNFIFTYINTTIKKYIKKNNLLKKGQFYYHPATKTHIFPLEYSMKHKNYLQDFYLFKNIINYAKPFRKVINQIKPDIVHIHGTLLPQFLFVANLARKNSKVIATHHIGLINQNYQQQKYRITLLKYGIHNLFPFFCNQIVSVSHHGKKSFDFLRKKVKVINPVPLIPIRISKFKNFSQHNQLKNDFQLKSNNIYSCLGRINHQKNQLNIIKAFNKLIEKNSNHQMILAGDLDSSEYCKKVVVEINKHPKNYCLLKNLTNQEALGIIKTSNYLVSISYNEGFGRIGMEGQLLGKPIIAGKDSGYGDYIQHGINGLLINPNNLSEIELSFTNIKKILPNRKYSHQNYIEKILQVYGGENEKSRNSS